MIERLEVQVNPQDWPSLEKFECNSLVSVNRSGLFSPFPVTDCEPAVQRSPHAGQLRVAATISWPDAERNAAPGCMTRKHRWIGVVIALAPLCFGAFGCNGKTECNIDSQSRALGGAGLIDCGIASADDPSDIFDRVDSCAVEAYQARGTFRALYENEDGTLEGTVHSAGGTFHLVRAPADDAHVDQADCDGAHVIVEDGRTYVHCDSPTAFARICP
jgi:hypothetical protein